MSLARWHFEGYTTILIDIHIYIVIIIILIRTILLVIMIPVVLHKAVAEVSKIGNL